MFNLNTGITMIRTVTLADANNIALIYNHYIANTTVTFEQDPLNGTDMASRFEAALADALPWLVLELDGELVGYAYASKWRSRFGYRFSLECSVYLAPDATGKGYGSLLLQQLLADIRQKGYHTVMAGIALPNAESVALHEKFGFKKAAHFTQVGTKFGQWLDVGYWQLMLPEH